MRSAKGCRRVLRVLRYRVTGELQMKVFRLAGQPRIQQNILKFWVQNSREKVPEEELLFVPTVRGLWTLNVFVTAELKYYGLMCICGVAEPTASS